MKGFFNVKFLEYDFSQIVDGVENVCYCKEGQDYYNQVEGEVYLFECGVFKGCEFFFLFWYY